MPKFDASTPTMTRKFGDITLTVPAPFIEGSTRTANEAKFDNNQVASVVLNGYSGDVRRAKEAGKDVSIWDHQALFNAKYADYELGVSNRGSGKGTSANTELHRTITFLAREDLIARLIKAGRTVQSVQKAPASDPTAYKSAWAELLAKSIALGHNKDGSIVWADEAQRIIDQRAADAAQDTAPDDLLSTLGEPVAAAA